MSKLEQSKALVDSAMGIILGRMEYKHDRVFVQNTLEVLFSVVEQYERTLRMISDGVEDPAKLATEMLSHMGVMNDETKQ